MSLKPYLENIIEKTSTVLDIGCGNKTYSTISSNTTTVDAWEKVNPDFLLDVTKDSLPFEENSFDYITMLDFIEHIDKESGLALLDQCKKIARKKIILFTPLFWDTNEDNVNDPDLWCYGNPYDIHKSLWTEQDFEGWTVIDIIKQRKGNCWLGYWEK